jgi:DNA (cytosine-5)-methyltransferase 1
MLDLGVRLAIPTARTVCYVEIESYACEILASRMEDKILDKAPIWTDLRTFDSKPWRGKVDCIIGGYPCQPFSIAGRQKGEEDPRHLWPYIADIIRDVAPRYCFFENVENHLNIGFREVRDELQEIGYSVKAGIFSAHEVGAPHQRKRLFILANSKRIGRGRRGEVVRHKEIQERSCSEVEAERSGGKLADGINEPDGVLDTRQLGLVVNPNEYGCSVYKLSGTREDGTQRRSKCSETFWSVSASYTPVKLSKNDTRAKFPKRPIYSKRKRYPIWPPGPKSNGWWDVGHELRPAISKTEPPVLRVADGVDSWMDRPIDSNRAERLQAVGNGVVPLTAAIAISVLGDLIV